MVMRVDTRTLLKAGIVGPILFVAIFLVVGATTTGYDPVRHFVSLLSLGSNGWIQVANFIAGGTLISAFGIGLHRTWASGPAATWTPRLVIAAGLGLVISGIFPGDPALGYPPGAPAGLPPDASWHAGIHYLGATVVFVGLPVAMTIAARRAIVMGDRVSAAYALVSAAVMFGAWIAPFVIAGTGASATSAGLLQRIGVLGGFQWLVVAASTASRRHVAPRSDGVRT